MELIKKGKHPANIIYRGVCHYCHSIMEAERCELTISDHRNETYYYAKCLLCEKDVSFIEKQVDDRTEPYG